MLEVKGVSKSYSSGNLFRKKKRLALKDISFNLNDHETLCIVGESGCGKTTLAKCLVGLEKVNAGMIKAGEHILNSDKGTVISEIMSRIQIIFQNPDMSLNPKKTIYQVLAEPLILQKVPKSQFNKIIVDSIESVGLGERYLKYYPHQLSGGQNQRIAVARAILMSPDILIADEVTSALDVSVQAHIVHLLMKLKQDRGMTLIFISHDLTLVRRIADRVIVMKDGRIVEIGHTSDIFQNPSHEYTKLLIENMNKMSLTTENKQEIENVVDLESPVMTRIPVLGK